jgi:hypothetical protein
MMYEELYRYFIQHNQLTLPGIGTFIAERKPAEADFINKQLLAPSYSVLLQKGGTVPAQRFFGWLAAALHTNEREAFTQFNDFVTGLKKQIANGATVNWRGIGTLSNGIGGAIKFSPEPALTEEPVPAEKVIREKPEHMIRVGEQEKTSAEMTEMLSQPVAKRSYWRAYAAAVAIAAFIFIGWYFSQRGISVSSTSNIKKLTPMEADAAYRILP